MFVGEAPGDKEDRTGIPFVGEAGKTFNKFLQFAGLTREDCYVTNVVKHRPFKNRLPYAVEIKACRPFLEQELQDVQPKYVVAMGNLAIAWFQKGLRLKMEHGKARFLPNGAILIPWYHPSYPNRIPAMMGVCLQDAIRLQDEVALVQKPPLTPRYELITEEQADVILGNLPDGVILAVDTETSSPRAGGHFATDSAVLVGYSFSFQPGVAYYVHTGRLCRRIRDILQTRTVVKVAHNAKFEYKLFRRHGIDFQNFHDTKLMAYVLGEFNTGLKELSVQHLNVHAPTYDEVTQGRDMTELTPQEIFWYACADADNTLRLFQILKEKINVAV